MAENRAVPCACRRRRLLMAVGPMAHSPGRADELPGPARTAARRRPSRPPSRRTPSWPGRSDREAGRRERRGGPGRHALRRRRRDADRRASGTPRPFPRRATRRLPACPASGGSSTPKEGRKTIEARTAVEAIQANGRGARGTTARRGHRDLRPRRRRGRSREAGPPRPVARAAHAPRRASCRSTSRRRWRAPATGARCAWCPEQARASTSSVTRATPGVQRQAADAGRRGPDATGPAAGCTSATAARPTSRPIARSAVRAGGLPGGLQPHRQRPPARPATSSRPTSSSSCAAWPLLRFAAQLAPQAFVVLPEGRRRAGDFELVRFPAADDPDDAPRLAHPRARPDVRGHPERVLPRASTSR